MSLLHNDSLRFAAPMRRDRAQVDALLVDLFLEAYERAPREIVLDLDNTDNTATCRSTCSAIDTCCWPGSDVRMSRVVASWRRSARNGGGCV